MEVQGLPLPPPPLGLRQLRPQRDPTAVEQARGALAKPGCDSSVGSEGPGLGVGWGLLAPGRAPSATARVSDWCQVWGRARAGASEVKEEGRVQCPLQGLSSAQQLSSHRQSLRPRPPCSSKGHGDPWPSADPLGTSARLRRGDIGRRPAGRDKGLFCASGLSGCNSSQGAELSLLTSASGVWPEAPWSVHWLEGRTPRDLPFGSSVRLFATEPCVGVLGPDLSTCCLHTLWSLG